MQRIVRNALVANLILALIFLYTNFSLWNAVNVDNNYLVASHWSPLGVSAPHYLLHDNGFVSVVETVYLYFNTPFWIFWLLLTVNLYAVIKLSREAKQNSR